MTTGVQNATDTVTVFLVEDHNLVRQEVRDLLSRDPRIQVVGEAATSSQAISSISQLRPDVVLLDIKLPDGTGIDVGRAVRVASPQTKILILSAYDEDQYVTKLTRLGIAGYLVKTVSGDDLIRAIHNAANGWLVFAPQVAPKVLGLFDHNGRPESHQNGTTRNLTTRETGILQHMARGLRNKDIAKSMGVSVKTVEAHVESILLKLGAGNRTEAVVCALQSGLLEKD